MKVVLKIEAGPDQGKEFTYEEAASLMVGRRDPSGHADIQINPADPYVSRHHCQFEIEPPEVMVRDINSANGTYLQRSGQTGWERITETQMDPGDKIKIGKTIFGLEVIDDEVETLLYSMKLIFDSIPPAQEQNQPRQESGSRQESGGKPAPARKTDWSCVRCGEPINENELPPADKSLTGFDFMCSNCRRQVLSQEPAIPRIELVFPCVNCGKNLGEMANADGRALALGDIASYLCPSCAARAGSVSPNRIGNYDVLSQLGSGGMGTVYKVWHRSTGRLAALKLMRPEARMDQTSVNRFFREAAIMDVLNNPGMVRLYEMGQYNRAPFIASEFVPDGSMDQFGMLNGYPQSTVREIVNVTADALGALQFMHQQGFVHRDLKPQNILIRRKGGVIQTKLADFGLSRSYQRHGATFTRAGEIAGTLPYMAKEQLTDFKGSQPCVDIYSMGVVLYFLLSGHFPLSFPAPSDPPGMVAFSSNPIKIITDDQPKPITRYRPDLPPRLSQAIDRAVQKEADRRFATAEDFRRAILQAI
jgi:serine/threonine-protein kinase